MQEKQKRFTLPRLRGESRQCRERQRRPVTRTGWMQEIHRALLPVVASEVRPPSSSSAEACICSSGAPEENSRIVETAQRR